MYVLKKEMEGYYYIFEQNQALNKFTNMKYIPRLQKIIFMRKTIMSLL